MLPWEGAAALAAATLAYDWAAIVLVVPVGDVVPVVPVVGCGCCWANDARVFQLVARLNERLVVCQTVRCHE